MKENSGNRKFVELEWVCPSCDGRNKGSQKTCASCGAPQPDNIKFQRAADEQIVTDEKQLEAAKAGADIHCGFCGTRNRGDAVTCSQCGGDLKEGKARAAGQVLQASAAPKTVKCDNCETENPGSERLCAKCGSPLSRAAAAQSIPAQAQAQAAAQPTDAQPKKTNWLLIGGILGALLLCCITAVIMLTRPSKTAQGTVTSVAWQTSVPVQEMRAVNYTHQMGSAPVGAENVSCQTESEESCTTSMVDQGNGFAEEVTECTTNNTQYCDYTVDEWTTINTYPLSGADNFPVYAEPTIYSGQQLGTKTEELTVNFSTPDGQEVYNPASVSEFQQFEIGSTWKLNMNAFGGVLSVER